MAEWEESMSTGGHQSGEIETSSVACEAAAIALERCKYVTAVEGGMLRSCTKSGEERRDYGVWLQQLRSGCGSEEEFNTARSKPNWTQVAGTSSCSSEGMSPAEKEMIVSENQRFFQDLINKQPRPPRGRPDSPSWSQFEDFIMISGFFVDLGGRLEVGKRIGGGGQAEIYESLFDGKKALGGDIPLNERGIVLKVFRLEHSEFFRHAWAKESKALHMQFIKEGWRLWYCCVESCTILKDGRFAFLLARYWGDLRKAIDDQILKDETHLRPPFPLPMSIFIMRRIALGLEALHGHGILHRDLKAENVLLSHDIEEYLRDGGFHWDCHVADFESAEGVMGTRFWMAPEVLRILRSNAKDKHSDPTVWTTKVDVYAYAMTCYEVLSGCIPFHNRAPKDYDIGDERPVLPDYVDEEIQELLGQCWNSDPSKRPSFEIICYRLQRYMDRKIRHSRSLAEYKRDKEAVMWVKVSKEFFKHNI